MPLNTVQVFEPDPPEREVASRELFTTEPVTHVVSATAVVDHHRSRWRIEEYFRSLKQGCAVDERQLESFDAMTDAIAMLVPFAWRLLNAALSRSIRDVPPCGRRVRAGRDRRAPRTPRAQGVQAAPEEPDDATHDARRKRTPKM